MDSIFRVNTELDIPIYRQLVDSIRVAIQKNNLSAGQQLPTVQELTQRLSIARGTVKRAYDELERIGLVEKVQGRGTFVCYQPVNSGSRKEQAMAAIDDVLDRLEQMGFSASEINIFLNLKLRERAEEETHIKVAVVECNPENLAQMSEQLRHINGVDLYRYLLESIHQYPYILVEDFDLIVTTAEHADYLESVVPQNKKVIRTALRVSTGCMAQIIKLRPGKKVGVIGHSRRFGELIYSTCNFYAEDVLLSAPMAEEDDTKIAEYLADKDVLLVPGCYEKLFGNRTVDELQKFHGTVIECSYEMDEGSVLYLETKIKRLQDEKRI